MRTTFLIHYATREGDSLEVALDGRPTPMERAGSGWWQATEYARRDAPYHYRLVAEGALVVEEQGPQRRTPRSGANQVTVVDRWKAPSPYRAERGSSLFSRVLAARHSPARRSGDAGGITFRLLEPDIAPGTVPAVAGSAASLGGWDTSAAVPMEPDPFPWWSVTVPQGDPGEWSQAGGYKYVLVDAGGNLVRWEDGEDRSLPSLEAFPVVVEDDGVRGLSAWRGAGVAVPVFALRTDRSVGVGQFTDLIPFVDWAADAGLSLVQMLPVNDTVALHTWDDAYPYNVVSVLALHPQYADLEDLGLDEDAAAAIAGDVAALRAATDGLPEIDYAAVMAGKWDILAKAHALAPQADPDLDRFVEAEREWLLPYAAWCALRDRHGTPDHAAWGEDSAYSAARVEAMAAPPSPQWAAVRLHCWVQYHLYRQFDAAAAHARSRGVALKGDIPIGVSPASVEVWTNPGQFHLGAQAGAPPDAYAALGQNWGFPTYDWEAMAQDGYAWWRRRFAAMARHSDVYRIDHILGFFRIWEIPADAVDGRLGRFRPCLPLDPAQVAEFLGLPTLGPLCRPTVDGAVLQSRFGAFVEEVAAAFFDGPPDDLRLRMTTQRDIIAAIDAGALQGIPQDVRSEIELNLLDIAGDVLLLEAAGGLHPRIAWDSVETYRRFDRPLQVRFDALAEDFFYRRHDELWEAMARTTIPAVVDATDMLACGEDLGMVQPMVPVVMNDLGLLSLEVERMSKVSGAAIADPANAPYLSVVTPSTHDSSPLREWWTEDTALTTYYWRQVLGGEGDPPEEASPEIIAAIVARHLESPAMLCIVPLSDYTSMDASVRRSDGLTERINDPADRHHRWRYRMHLTVADLAASPFTTRLRSLIHTAGR